MNAPRTAISLLTATLALSLATAPALAAEEPLIPPGNSAVNQYTESFPTSGGNRKVDEPRRRRPREVLGEKNARELESRGDDGRAVAELAAETAPVAAAGTSGGGGNSGASPQAGSGGEQGAAAQGGATARGGTGSNVAEPEGSSGLGEVLGQATGSTESGELGLLLPLIVLAAIGGSIAFLLRQKRTEH